MMGFTRAATAAATVATTTYSSFYVALFLIGLNFYKNKEENVEEEE